MAAGNLSPRQRMINLMYLVFIAMLAMQIDQEVLRSFQGINESLEKTSKRGIDINKLFYDDLIKKAGVDPETYAEKNQKAKELKPMTQSIINEIEKLKTELGAAEFRTAEDINYNALSNTEEITNLFFLGEGFKNDDKGNKVAQEFVSNTKDYVSNLKKLVQEKEVNNKIDETFSYLNDEKGRSWLNKTFYNQPVVAALTNLTKLQSDIIATESAILNNWMVTKLEEIELKKYIAISRVPSVVEKGDEAYLEVYVGNVSDGIEGSASVGGKPYPIQAGVAKIQIGTGRVGENEVKGVLSFKSGAKTENLDFDAKYFVSEFISDTNPAVTGVITADKMNVVYRGLPNPLTVNMSGTITGTERIAIKEGTGNLKFDGGNKYTFTPTKGNTVTFAPSGLSLAEKKTVSGKPTTFRIKNIPPAEGQIQGSNRIALPRASLAKQRVSAAMPGFLFDLTLSVTEFKVKIPGQKTIVCSGDRFNAAARDAISNAPGGEAAVIFDIKATTNYGVPPERVSPIIVALQ